MFEAQSIPGQLTQELESFLKSALGRDYFEKRLTYAREEGQIKINTEQFPWANGVHELLKSVFLVSQLRVGFGVDAVFIPEAQAETALGIVQDYLYNQDNADAPVVHPV